MRDPVQIDCPTCKSVGSMGPDTVPKLGAFPRVLGIALLVIGLVVLALAVLMVVGTSSVMQEAGDDPLASGMVAGMGYTMAAGYALTGLVFAAIGSVLRGKRKVIRCGRCGYAVDRT